MVLASAEATTSKTTGTFTMILAKKAVLGTVALLASLAATPVLAQGTLRIGMTASDIPLTTGQTDQGGEGMRFMGYTVYDALINWDLSSCRQGLGAGAGARHRVEGRREANPTKLDLHPARRREVPRRQRLRGRMPWSGTSRRC
jgi:hypothetical protein